MSPESRHVAVWVAVTAPDAYAFAADPHNLPAWAAGLASGEVRPAGEAWAVSSPMGDVTVEFSPRNAFGVLDHVVGLPDGQGVYNPMRVIPAGGGQTACEVVFTVRRRPGMSDVEFDADIAAVAADLQTLKALLER